MRQLLGILCLILICNTYLFGAFGTATAFDVSASVPGVDTNGGGFDSGVASPGTDESHGAGTAMTCTLSGTGTTATCSPAITSTTHGPGNFFYPASGAGCTTGTRVEIISQSAGTATFDKSAGTAGSACVGTLGGSLLTVSAATALCVTGGNSVYVQSGTYTRTALLDVANCYAIIGYQTTHGDLDSLAWTNWTSASSHFPLITTATDSTNLIKFSVNQRYKLQNLSLSNTASVRAEGMYASLHTPKLMLQSIILDGFTKAVDCDNTTNSDCTVYLFNGEIKNSTGYAIGVNGFPLVIYSSYIHDNPTTASSTFLTIGEITSYLEIDRSIIANNTGGTQMGISLGSGATLLMRDSDYVGNGGGIIGASTGSMTVSNSIIYGQSSTGINCSSTSAILLLVGNAYGGNGTDTSGCGGSGTDAIALSANPFTSSTDFTLNSTAGGGALLKGLGLPAIFPGGVTTSVSNVGAVSSSSSGGSSSSVQTTVQN